MLHEFLEKYPQKKLDILGANSIAWDMSALNCTGVRTFLNKKGEEFTLQIQKSRHISEIALVNVETATLIRCSNQSVVLRLATGGEKVDVVLPGGLTFVTLPDGTGRLVREVVGMEYMATHTLQ